MIPFNNNHFHYNWHWYWDTGTSEFGNNGVHLMDVIRWGMKKNEHPKKIHCSGGFFAWDSDQQVPNLQVATYEFADGTMMETEVRSLFTNPEHPDKSGCFFYGTKGWMQLGDQGYVVFLGPKNEPGPSLKASEMEKNEYDKAEIDFHFVNFLDCVRSRKIEDLNAEIHEGYMSTSMMLMGNIAYRTGRKLIFDGKTEKFVNDDDANTYLERAEYRKPFILPSEV